LTPALDPLAVTHALWRAGDLSYLLHEDQERVRDALCASASRRFVAKCARRWGKSVLAVAIGVEMCLQKPGAQVRYAAPTAKMVRTIVRPHLRMLLEDCPPDIMPEWKLAEGVLVFPNGSELHVAGVDSGGADRLRGVSTDLAIVDEAGFVDDLEYLVQSVLLPQLITTDGRIFLISTPPVTPAHPFTLYCARAEAEGAFVHRTIHDAPHITAEQAAEYAAEAGGEDSVAWQREGLARDVVDSTRAVLPEWIEQEAAVCVEHVAPPHRFYQVALDVGYADLSFAVFGYYDFRADLDVIEGELTWQRATSRTIDDDIRAMELELWGELSKVGRDGAPMVARHADAPPFIVAELNEANGRHWLSAAKDDLSAAVNRLRVRIGSGRMRVHPRCVQLRAHARTAIWRVPGRDFERVEGFGHFDGVAALNYWSRHLNRSRNPYPALDPMVSANTHTILVPERPANESLAFVGARRGRR
jgi:hypothetical protein